MVLRPYRSPYGSPRIEYYQESTAAAASATIRVGDVVRRSTVTSTGGLRVVRDWSTAGGGGNLVHIGGAEVIGIAVTPSTATDPSNGGLAGAYVDDSSIALNQMGPRTVGVAIADGLTEYLGHFYQGDTAAKAASSRAGSVVPLQYDSTRNTYFVASTNSTAAIANVRIVGFPTDALGDSGGVPCLFKFLSSQVHTAVNIASNLQ